MTIEIQNIDDLARFLVSMNMGSAEAIEKLAAMFPDANAEAAVAAAKRSIELRKTKRAAIKHEQH